MTEEEAHDYVASLDVPRETLQRLEILASSVARNVNDQNLISRSTLTQVWSRHIADSMQLLPLAPSGSWVDIGSGAGFPGLAVAAANDRTVTLIEPRRKRAAFLWDVIDDMKLKKVTVAACRVETFAGGCFDVVSARAVAPLERLFAAAYHLARPETVWLLPKGRSARDELAAAERSWQGDFQLVPSITDSAAAIVVVRHLKRREDR